GGRRCRGGEGGGVVRGVGGVVQVGRAMAPAPGRPRPGGGVRSPSPGRHAAVPVSLRPLRRDAPPLLLWGAICVRFAPKSVQSGPRRSAVPHICATAPADAAHRRPHMNTRTPRGALVALPAGLITTAWLSAG